MILNIEIPQLLTRLEASQSSEEEADITKKQKEKKKFGSPGCYVSSQHEQPFALQNSILQKATSKVFVP
jgi:hypothetical protein